MIKTKTTKKKTVPAKPKAAPAANRKTKPAAKKVAAAAVKKPVKKPVSRIRPEARKPAVHTKEHPAKITAKIPEPKPVIAEPLIIKASPAAAPAKEPSLAAPSVAAPAEKEIKKEAPVVKEEVFEEKQPLPGKEIELAFPVNVKDLSVRLQEKSSVLIKHLMGMGIMAGINQQLEEKVVHELCAKLGFRAKRAPGKEELLLASHKQKDNPADLSHRSPVVTFMGHVDHGKTSLLDAVRKSKVVELEHGGITQHIGAYRVSLGQGEITFLDTPGHEAFTAMRAHGASITDIVVLVVAADDGVMPQTQEAIDHAKAAGVSIIVALNKIDKPGADPDRVKKQLSEVNLLAEDWGGKTIIVPVSAKTGQGIDLLLEMILLEAQMLELRANPHRLARGVVVEAKMTKGKGAVSTILVQNGTLRLNDNVIAGKFYGKVRAMFDDRGRSVTEAPPTFPVEVLGISGVPEAGEQVFAVEDEKIAKEIVGKRQEQQRLQQLGTVKRISLEDLYAQIKEGKIKELKIVIKADVQGSLAAIKEILGKFEVSEIKLDIIHEGIGGINYSDVILAVASNALILGFNVAADERARELADKEGVDVRTYNIIYELGNDMKAALEGMLEPKLKKVFLGRAEVRKVFKLPKAGMVAGCFVSKGKFNRSCSVALVRNGEVQFEGKLSSLKRFKDDVREVAEGYECGMALDGFDALQEGDIIEAHEIEKIARKL